MSFRDPDQRSIDGTHHSTNRRIRTSGDEDKLMSQEENNHYTMTRSPGIQIHVVTGVSDILHLLPGMEHPNITVIRLIIYF